MKCPKCEFESPEGSKFCLECGAKFAAQCPQCGNSLPTTAKFCNECGQPLKEPEGSAPVDYAAPHSYTPKHLTDKILNTRSSLEGERKTVTVLFADVASYTSLSETFDPEEVHQIMDGCFEILMDEIHGHEGAINQFTGDGVMALFGAPVAHEDHAQRACHAALSIQKAMGAYGAKVEKDCGVAFQMRIGLNSGPVIVGSIGDDLRMDYTAVGDTTNLASRMESLAPPGAIRVSANTHKLARDFFEFESLGKLEVKGKEKPQEAYELRGASSVETRIEAAAAKGLTQFVGRKSSMAALVEAWDQSRSGSGQVVGIVGEAGVGKSRLLLEFRNRLSPGEFTYLEGHCLHYGSALAYLPALDILRSYFGIEEGDREFVIKKKIEEKVLGLDETLGSTLPFFQDLLSLPVEDETYRKLEPKEKRERTFDAIRDLLIRESQNQPLVVAVEDLQWIDNTTSELLDYLIGWLTTSRILLVLLHRPEYTHPWGGKSYYNRIGLSQLTLESSSELVRAILEGGEVAPELAELILYRAAGNPLFLEEFTHTLVENGSIRREGQQFVLARKASDVQVPDSIQGIIAARMDRLEENLKRTMQVASVIGRDFAFRILQSITEMRTELKTHLLNLQGLEFIYEKQLFPELEYVFKHALTQEVAYNSLLARRRKNIHERIAEAIEEIYTSRLTEFWEILAYHYSKSDNAEKAYKYTLLSAQKAAQNYSNLESLNLYKQAIDLIANLPNDSEQAKRKIDVYQQMSLPLGLLGDPEGSLEIFHEGAKLSKEIGDQRSLAVFGARLSNYHVYKGDFQAAMKHARNFFQEAEKIQDPELMAILTHGLCATYSETGRFVESVDLASQAIALLEKLGDKELSPRARWSYPMLCGRRAQGHALLGDFDEAIAQCEKGLRIATELDGAWILGLLEYFYGQLFAVRGDGEKAIEHLTKCITHLEKAHAPANLGWAWSVLGLAYGFMGDFDNALRYADKGLALQTDKGLAAHFHHFALSSVYSWRNELDKSRLAVEKSLQLSRESGSKSAGGPLLQLGWLIAKNDPSKMEQAKNSIMEGMRILDECQMKPHYARGYLYLAEVHESAGERDQAIQNLQKAEAMFEEMGMKYWLASTYVVYAELFKRQADLLQARGHLNKAIGVFQECGADGWVKRTEEKLAQL